MSAPTIRVVLKEADPVFARDPADDGIGTEGIAGQLGSGHSAASRRARAVLADRAKCTPEETIPR